MIKLKDLLMEAVNVAKQSTKSLLRLHGQMKDERLSGQSALLFRLITKELVKRKVKLESVNEVSFSSVSTKKLVKQYKQMADEKLSGSAALTFRMIAKELTKRKFKLESVNEASSFDSVAKGWVKYFLKRHGKDIFKNVIAGRKKERGKYSITDSDLWDQFGYYQHKDKKFGDWMGALAMIDFTLVSDMLGKEFSKKYPVEW